MSAFFRRIELGVEGAIEVEKGILSGDVAVSVPGYDCAARVSLTPAQLRELAAHCVACAARLEPAK